MLEIKLIKNEVFDDAIEFETQISVSEKLKSVGNLKITDIPFVDKVYTRDIIGQETRNYDIKYITYENCNEYHSVVVLNIPEGKKFTEVPENKTFTFLNTSSPENNILPKNPLNIVSSFIS